MTRTNPPRAVFMDWHGVMCSQRFWHHLPASHPVNARHAARVFADDALLVRWMTGQLSAEGMLAACLPADEVAGALEELRRSCALMRPDPGMAELLARLATRAQVAAVATDNMDCFAWAWAWSCVPLGGRRVPLLCSSDLGTLKGDPQRFFGVALSGAGLGPADALLVDDSPGNCAAFRSWGGRAVEFRDRDQAAAELTAMGALDA